MKLTIRLLRETDGRWIGDVPELPGVTVYGATVEEATLRAKALALRVIAEEIEHGEVKPDGDTFQFSIAARANGPPRRRSALFALSRYVPYCPRESRGALDDCNSLMRSGEFCDNCGCADE